MDPNAALSRIRALITSSHELAQVARVRESRQLLTMAADTFGALDDWLSKGGALPDAWERQTRVNGSPECSQHPGKPWYHCY